MRLRQTFWRLCWATSTYLDLQERHGDDLSGATFLPSTLAYSGITKSWSTCFPDSRFKSSCKRQRSSKCSYGPSPGFAIGHQLSYYGARVLTEILMLANDPNPEAPSILANSLRHKYRATPDWAWKVWYNTVASQILVLIPDINARRACALRYANFLLHVDEHLPNGFDDPTLQPSSQSRRMLTSLRICGARCVQVAVPMHSHVGYLNPSTRYSHLSLARAHGCPVCSFYHQSPCASSPCAVCREPVRPRARRGCFYALFLENVPDNVGGRRDRAVDVGRTPLRQGRQLSPAHVVQLWTLSRLNCRQKTMRTETKVKNPRRRKIRPPPSQGRPRHPARLWVHPRIGKHPRP
jgi:hypothetical protein